MMKVFFLLVSVLMTKYLFSAKAQGAVEVGGYLDTYYAFDLGRPATNERPYTTTAVRHNEFNVNLAFLEAIVQKSKTTARLAMQAGTSVQNNYATEPSRGSTSGGNLSRHLQEAWLEYAISSKTSLKTGIYFSHLGIENFVSDQNFAYSRSLAADYSPYYQSGLALTHKSSSHQFEIHLINGWQNISEDNDDKALGLKYQYRPNRNDEIVLTYANFLGSYRTKGRFFHDFNIEWKISQRLALIALFDFGTQENAHKKKKNFYTSNLQVRFASSEDSSVALRAEWYSDPEQLNLASVTGKPVEIYGGSLTYNKNLDADVLWRAEIRHLRSSKNHFVDGIKNDDNNTLFSSSFSFRF